MANAPSTASRPPSPADAGEVFGSKTSPIHGGGGPEGWRGRWAGVALAIAFAPTAALAHPGDHSHMAAVEAARHLLTEPDHLAVLLAGVVGLAAAAWVSRPRRAR